MWETPYKNGKKNGLSTHWHRSGKKRWEAYYIDDIDSYESGEKKSESQSWNGGRDGLATTWYKSGEKKSEVSWTNDTKDGSMTEWYKNGKEHGVRTEWSEDGKKTFQANFIDGNEE